jgi:hypothetical protein
VPWAKGIYLDRQEPPIQRAIGIQDLAFLGVFVIPWG